MKTKFPSKHSGPSESPGFLLWQVTNLWQRKQREALALFDLTHVQFVLLAGIFWLENQKEKVSQNKLASFTCMDKMMTSQVVRKLAEKGWVKRESDLSDGRAILLHITEKGRSLIRKAMPVVEEVDHKFFRQLRSKQGQFCGILSILNQTNSL